MGASDERRAGGGGGGGGGAGGGYLSSKACSSFPGLTAGYGSPAH